MSRRGRPAAAASISGGGAVVAAPKLEKQEKAKGKSKYLVLNCFVISFTDLKL